MFFNLHTLLLRMRPADEGKKARYSKGTSMIVSLFQYAFIAPVQPGDDYSEYDLNRYKNCHYVGLFRGICNCHQNVTPKLIRPRLKACAGGWPQMAMTRE